MGLCAVRQTVNHRLYTQEGKGWPTCYAHQVWARLPQHPQPLCAHLGPPLLGVPPHGGEAGGAAVQGECYSYIKCREGCLRPLDVLSNASLRRTGPHMFSSNEAGAA